MKTTKNVHKTRKRVALTGFTLGPILLYVGWLVMCKSTNWFTGFLMYAFQFLGVIAVIFATFALGAIYNRE